MVCRSRTVQLIIGSVLGIATSLWASTVSAQTVPASSSENSINAFSAERNGEATAKVAPISGRVHVQLYNNIGTQVVFEVPGYMMPTVLEPGKEITIQDLPIPATLKFSRTDGGLLKVQPQTPKQPNTLNVALDEASPLNDDSGLVQIQENGQVVLTP
jgi:hypothetical protein